MVTSADAVVDPGAVVIELVDALAAQVAVPAPGRFEYLTLKTQVFRVVFYHEVQKVGLWNRAFIIATVGIGLVVILVFQVTGIFLAQVVVQADADDEQHNLQLEREVHSFLSTPQWQVGVSLVAVGAVQHHRLGRFQYWVALVNFPLIYAKNSRKNIKIQKQKAREHNHEKALQRFAAFSAPTKLRPEGEAVTPLERVVFAQKCLFWLMN